MEAIKIPKRVLIAKEFYLKNCSWNTFPQLSIGPVNPTQRWAVYYISRDMKAVNSINLT